MSWNAALVIAGALVVFYGYQHVRPRFLGHFLWKSKRHPLPPGPKPMPFIGNLFDVPAEYQWLKFAEFAETYGDIVHLTVMGSHIICLNSLKVVKDLLEKRSSKYSGRARLPMLKDLAGWDEWAFGFMDYGPRFRATRKMAHTQFNASVSHKYRPTQNAEAVRMISRILENPDLFRAHIRHYVGAVIMSITYGILLPSPGDKYLIIADKVSKHLEGGTRGRSLVDYIPLLTYVPAWFPGGGFHNIAKQWRAETDDLIHVPFNAVKRAMADANATTLPSLVSSLLESFSHSENAEKDETIARHAAASAYAAGSDTTAGPMAGLFLGVAMYPEVQKKARAELDLVIGRERLPNFSDRPNLPYLEAVVRECLRWQPVAPLSNPHTLAESDEYEGYTLPKGAICMPNTWAILHDERVFPDPHVFNPDRFLKDGKINTEVLNPAEAAYGFGRRICPGRFVADNSLFITSALVLSCLCVEPALDSSNNPVPLKPQMGPYLISHPEPFKCIVKPRFAGVHDLVERAMEDFDYMFAT